jgi:hypothetical protein
LVFWDTKLCKRLAKSCHTFASNGGPFGTVPELLFEKKKFIPELQRLLVQAENTS